MPPLAVSPAGGAATVDRLSALAPVAEEWDELAERLATDPFRSPAWIGAWHESFSRADLELVTVRRGRRLAGVLPLLRRGKWLRSPTNWHTPLFGALAEDASVLEMLAAELLRPRPHAVLLSFLDAADPLVPTLVSTARGAGQSVLVRPVLRSPYLDLEPGWEACWASLGSKRRNTLKRRRRRLERRGRIELEIFERGGRLPRLLDEAFALEARGWKGRRGSAIDSRPSTGRFYRRIAAAAAERGTLRLALLRSEQQLVAFDLALEAHGVHYLVKTGYEPELRECAPGLVLRTMMIERACSLGLRRYEFLGGEDPYKRDWTRDVRERLRVQLVRPSLSGLATGLAVRYGRPLAARARQGLAR